MESKEREIRLFVRANGRAPFEEFVRDVGDKRAKADIRRARAYAEELRANANEKL